MLLIPALLLIAVTQTDVATANVSADPELAALDACFDRTLQGTNLEGSSEADDLSIWLMSFCHLPQRAVALPDNCTSHPLSGEEQASCLLIGADAGLWRDSIVHERAAKALDRFYVNKHPVVDKAVSPGTLASKSDRNANVR